VHSFWPSLSLLAFFLVIFLECRVVCGRVTIPLGGFLAFFVYGCVGATLFSLLLQQIPYLQFAAVANAQGMPVLPAAWWIGPPVEEFAKALPVIVLAFLTAAWRRLSIADLTLAGFASGVGFGFVERNLAVLVNGKLPAIQHLYFFGYQSVQSAGGDYAFAFAGHAAYPALFALAAGIGLRLFPISRLYAWIPAAIVFAVVCFDHGMYNWKMLHPSAEGGAFLDAATTVEILYWLTLHGRIEVWLLPIGLIAAQFVEGRLCASILGRRADMVLPGEYRPWVLNEWFVGYSRLTYGCSAFDHTLAFFRRRRAFVIATLESNRVPANRPLAQYTRLLEQRVIQEQANLLAPPRADWFPPRAVFERNLKAWAWRMRWVLAFNVLFIPLFMLGNGEMPGWLRGFLSSEAFTAAMVAASAAFVVWRIYVFFRSPRLDPVASEGAAYADYHTRLLLLTAALTSGLSPALSIVLGWTGAAPGAAYLSFYFATWVGQGGNLYSVMGLGALGGAVEADPGPVGGALGDEIEAGETRIRRLERQYQRKIAFALPGAARESVHLDIEELHALIAQLDAERETQGRRKRALEAFERQAVETQVGNLGRAVETVIGEFERLRVEFDAALEAERQRIAAIKQGFDRHLSQIERELDAYDTSNAGLCESLRDLWRPRKDTDWALRIAQSTDEKAFPVLKSFVADLEAFAAKAGAETAGVLNLGISRLRAHGAPFARGAEAAPVQPAAKRDAAPALPELPEEPEEPKAVPVAAQTQRETPHAEEESAPVQPTEISETAPTESEFLGEQEELESIPIAAAIDAAPIPIEAPQALEEAAPAQQTEILEVAPSDPELSVESEEPVSVPAEEVIETAPIQIEAPQVIEEPAPILLDDRREPWSAPQIEPVPARYQPPAQPELDRAKKILDAELEAALEVASCAPDVADKNLPVCVNAPGWSLEDTDTSSGAKQSLQAAPAPSHDAEWLEGHDAPHPYDAAGVPKALENTETEEPWHAPLKEFVDLAREHAPEPEIIAEPEAQTEPDLPRIEDKTPVAAYVPVPTELPEKIAAPTEPDLPRIEDKTPVAAYVPVPTELPEKIVAPAESDLPRIEDKTPVAAYVPVSTELPEKIAAPAEPDLPKVEDKTPVAAYVPVPTELPEKIAAPAEPDLPRIEDKTPVAAYTPVPAELPEKIAAPAEPDLPTIEDKTPIVAYTPVPVELPEKIAAPTEPDLLTIEDKTPVAASTPLSTEHLKKDKLPAPPAATAAPVQKPVEPPAPAPLAAAQAGAHAAPQAGAHAAPQTAPTHGSIGKDLDDILVKLGQLEAATRGAARPERNPSSSTRRQEKIEPPKPAPQRAQADDMAPAGFADASPVMPSPAASPAMDAKIHIPEKSAAKESESDFAAAIRAIEKSQILVDMPRAAAGESEKSDDDLYGSHQPSADADIAGDPLEPSLDTDKPSDETERLGRDRGLGRGKFVREAGDKKTPASVAAASSVSFRPAKFYGNSATSEANDASGAARERARPQPQSNSIRSSKFYSSGTGASVDIADRTQAAANADTTAPIKSALAEALTEYFDRTGETPPPMHTVDSETLKEVSESGRLDTTRRGAAPWSFSGIPRRGDFAIRLKRGSDRYVEFVPSTVTFGQTPRYYARRIGVGTAQTYVPVEHLEYFDASAREWQALKR